MKALQHVIRRLQLAHNRFLVGALLLGLLAPVQVAAAATLTDLQFGGVTMSGNSAVFAAPGVATPARVNLTPNNLSGWYPAGNYGVPPKATGPTINMVGKGTLPFNGVNVPFESKLKLSKANLWRGVKGLTGGPLGMTVFGLQLMQDYLAEGGARINAAGDGVEVKDPNVCTVAPCYLYSTRSWGSTAIQSPYVSSKADACERARQQIEAATFAHQRPAVIVSSSTTCYVRNSASPTPSYYDWPYGTQSTSPSAPVYIPSTLDGLDAKMGADTVQVDPRVVPHVLDKGAAIDFPTPELTFPNSVSGPTTTKVNPDGSKVITSTTHNYSGGGTDRIVETGTVETQTTQDAAGTTTGTTTTTTQNTAETQDKEKEDQCALHPDSVGCSSLDTPSGEAIPKTTRDVSYTAEVLFGGGTCPANKTMTTHSGQTLTVWNWTQACDSITTYLRPIILILSAFAAMMILLPKAE